MHRSGYERYGLPLCCAALLLSLTGCPAQIRDALTHRPPPTSTPPAAGSGGSTPGDPSGPRLPDAPARCPTLATGNVKLHDVTIRLWVGDPQPNRRAPLLVYWHGTGSSAQEAQLLGPALEEILAEGGIVAAFEGSTGTGTDTLNGTWASGDFAVVDELVACASSQRALDVRRIYTAGCSAGAVQAGALAYARSSYVAAAMMNSGGKVRDVALQDPARVPAAIGAHGARDTDVVIVNFADATAAYAADLVDKGGFAVVCGHGGGHCAAPPELVKAQWEFLKAHPYGVEPEPYAAGLPSGFPAYCQIAM